MAYDHQEQEQLDELKAWWKEHGSLVLAGAFLVVLVIGGIQGWRYYQRSQALAAATLFEELQLADRGGDPKKVQEIAKVVTDRYGSTPYGAFAALSAARASFAEGDLAAAKTQLLWAVGNAKEDEVRDIARLRLAGVLLDEKNYAEALKHLEAKPVEPLVALYADMKGDILVAQGKSAEARSAYQLALDQSVAGSSYRSIVQLKLDGLGEVR